MENNTNNDNSLSRSLAWLGIPRKMQQTFILRLAVFWILMTAIIVIDSNKLLEEITISKPAPMTVICPRNISFPDKAETDKLRNKAKEEVKAIIVPKPSANELMLADFDKNINIFSEFYDRCKFGETGRNAKQLYKEMFPNGFFMDAESFEVIVRYPASVADNLKSSARECLVGICQKEIYDENFEEIKKEITKTATNAWTATSRQIFIKMIESVLTTNCYVDVNATNARKEEVAKNIQPVVKTYQKGQRIVAEGEIVTPEILEAYNEVQRQLKNNIFLSMLGSMLLLLLVIVLCMIYIRLQDINVFVDDVQYKLIGTLCFAFLLATKVVYSISIDSGKDFLLILLSPLASLTLLLTSTVSNIRIVYFILFWMGLLSFIVTEGNHPYLVVLIIGSIGGALSWDISFKDNDVVMRNTIIGTGLNIGVTTFIAVLAFMLMHNEALSVQGFYAMIGYSLCGLGNGLISSIVANGVLPNIENYFAFATPTRLLELTTETPLLKRLQEEAPGTYAHSIAVADMAAQAASAVGADSLLTKVCALYHDIGKIKRPEYYTENQHGVNPHDEKKPTMSAMIITSHVRDGVDMARSYKIPHRVIEIMSQHHGTTLVEYFYNKQKALTPGNADESQFRYKGLKPQTKEAAILLLADAVEASSRSLDGVLDSNRINEHVKRIVEHKLNDDNQLEENKLSLGEISIIEEEFAKVLLAANHKRVKYQNQIKQEAAEKAASEKAEAEKAEAEKVEAEKAEADKLVENTSENTDSAVEAASAEIAAKMAQAIETSNEADKKSEDKVG